MVQLETTPPSVKQFLSLNARCWQICGFLALPKAASKQQPRQSLTHTTHRQPPSNKTQCLAQLSLDCWISVACCGALAAGLELVCLMGSETAVRTLASVIHSWSFFGRAMGAPWRCWLLGCGSWSHFAAVRCSGGPLRAPAGALAGLLFGFRNCGRPSDRHLHPWLRPGRALAWSNACCKALAAVSSGPLPAPPAELGLRLG